MERNLNKRPPTKFTNVSVDKETLMFRFPVPPTGNKRMALVNGRFVKASSDRTYLSLIQTLLLARHVKPTLQDVAVKIIWARARKAGDIDNRWKTLLDSMQGIVYKNDSQIKKFSVEIDDTDKHNARVEVWISLIGSEIRKSSF